MNSFKIKSTTSADIDVQTGVDMILRGQAGTEHIDIDAIIRYIISNDFGTKNEDKGVYVDFLEALAAAERDDHKEEVTNHNSTEMGMDETSTTSWAANIDYISKRPKGWLGRLHRNHYNKLLEMQYTVLNQKNEENANAIGNFLSSYVQHIPEKPIKPDLYHIDKFKPNSDITLQSNFCMKCWQLVPFGISRVSCRSCNIAIHRDCIEDIEKYYVYDDARSMSSVSRVSSPSDCDFAAYDIMKAARKKITRMSSSKSFNEKLPHLQMRHKNGLARRSVHAASMSSPGGGDEDKEKPLDQKQEAKVHGLTALPVNHSLLGNHQKLPPKIISMQSSDSDMDDFEAKSVATTGTGATIGRSKSRRMSRSMSRQLSRESFLVPKRNSIIGVSIEKHLSNSVSFNFEESDPSPVPLLDDDVRPVSWCCEFCQHEVIISNNFFNRKYSSKLIIYKERRAIVKLQALFRMYPLRKSYLDNKYAALKIQKFHRSRNFRRALIKERTFQKRAVRIRLHEVILYVESDLKSSRAAVVSQDSSDATAGNNAVAPPKSTQVLGQFTANFFPRKIFDVKPIHASERICGVLGGTDRKVPQISKKSIILNCVKSSTLGSNDQEIQMPIKDLNGGPFPAKTLFLTVSVIQTEELGDDVQLYRIDVPMYPYADGSCDYITPKNGTMFPRLDASSQSYGNSRSGSPSSPIKPMTPGKNAPKIEHAFYKVLSEVSAFSAPENEKGMKILKIYPPKPMILLPACPSNVMINFTVSQAIGPCGPDDMPIPNNHTRLHVDWVDLEHSTHPRVTHKHKGDAKQMIETSADHTHDLSKAVLRRANTLVKQRIIQISERSAVKYTGGRVLWTLVPSSFIGTMCGHLYFIPTPNVNAGKSKYWAVIINSSLVIYGSATDMKPREIIDISVCTISLEDFKVIKITRSRGQMYVWYCFCATEKMKNVWVKVLRECSDILRSKKGEQCKWLSVMTSL